MGAYCLYIWGAMIYIKMLDMILTIYCFSFNHMGRKAKQKKVRYFVCFLSRNQRKPSQRKPALYFMPNSGDIPIEITRVRVLRYVL